MKYVCELCGLIYSEEQGDPKHGVPAGTVFAQLPEDYECPGCGSKKEAFNKAEKKAVPAAAADQAFWQSAKYADHHESDR